MISSYIDFYNECGHPYKQIINGKVRKYKDCLFVGLLKENFREDQVERILQFLSQVCPNCYSEYRPCNCVKDN